jgi:hypothetical protein
MVERIFDKNDVQVQFLKELKKQKKVGRVV